MGLGAALCVYPAGTERHMETPRLPTAPVNYSLFLCGPFELSICDGYFTQIPTIQVRKTCDQKLGPVTTGWILTVL